MAVPGGCVGQTSPVIEPAPALLPHTRPTRGLL